MSEPVWFNLRHYPNSSVVELDKTKTLRPEFYTFFAYVGNKRVGSISVDSNEITGFWIDAPHRGRGIGRTLLRLAENKVKSLGYNQAIGKVRINNAFAIAMYQRAGYLLVTNRTSLGHHCGVKYL